MIYQSNLLFDSTVQGVNFTSDGLYSYEWLNKKYGVALSTSNIGEAKVFCINVIDFVSFVESVNFDTLFTSEIKDKINSTTLVINHATEWVHKYSGVLFSRAWDMLVQKLQAAGIDSNRVVYVSGDLHIEDIYKKHNNTFNVVGINFFETLFFNRLPLKYEISEFAVDKKYEYLFLNSLPRGHRCVLRYFLEKNNLLSKGLWSWALPDSVGVDWQEIASFNNKFKLSLSNSEIAEIVELSKNTKILDVTRSSLHGSAPHNVLQQTWLNDTSYSLVTETNFDAFSDENIMFVTEKTYKPIYFFHPFLIFGQQGILKYLQAQGYCTFPELFNEDYDFLDGIEKINAVIESVAMFKDRAAGKEKVINEKLHHNRALFMSQPYEKTLKRKLTKIIAGCG